MSSIIEHTDPINAQILAVSEDKIAGFVREPFQAIADGCGLPLETVLDRIKTMLAAGTIRRVRQTLVASNLAEGALVAWQVPEDKLNSAFEWMFANDPFSGHVVVRSTDGQTTGSAFRLWTTLKTPVGVDMGAHCEVLMRHTGCTAYKLMPAKGIFALGVGHVRRKVIEPGDKTEEPARMIPVGIVSLTEQEWDVLLALKRELTLDEIRLGFWHGRAADAGVDYETFCKIAEDLNQRQVIGRFSTFLEHVKPSATGQRVTKFNALFHWRVPEGMQQRAGAEVGRHPILTHCYWREGGPDFANVNIMAVCHGTDKERVLAHKAAIDAHLASVGIPMTYTNVFWGGRSEIKPSEISPKVHLEWMARYGSAEPVTA
jgi:DNA-binding Lrp family transcriptional regulator